MCSIFGVLEVRQDLNAVRQMALRQSRLLRHRGPDWSGIYSADQAMAGRVHACRQREVPIPVSDVTIWRWANAAATRVGCEQIN